MFKLALDAGHGINTSGKRCLKSLDPNETREWTLNSRIVSKTIQKLSNYNIEILRIDDPTGKSDISLTERCNKANNWGADFYLSVHHNAGLGGRAGGGTEVYVYNGGCGQTSLDWQKQIYNDFCKTAPLTTKRSGGGTKQANFAVLRQTKMPAVLTECAFMDSPTDVPVILTEEWADKAATALVNSIITMAQITPKAPVKKTQGYVDIANPTQITGWTYNSVDDTALEVHIYFYKDGKQILGIPGTIANIYREDLKKAGIGNGYHGFCYSYDAGNILDDGTYSVKVFAIDGMGNKQLSEEKTFTTNRKAEIAKAEEERLAKEEAEKRAAQEAEEARIKAEQEASSQKAIDNLEKMNAELQEHIEKTETQNQVENQTTTDIITEEQKQNVLSLLAEFIIKLIKSIFGNGDKI